MGRKSALVLHHIQAGIGGELALILHKHKAAGLGHDDDGDGNGQADARNTCQLFELAVSSGSAVSSSAKSWSRALSCCMISPCWAASRARIRLSG